MGEKQTMVIVVGAGPAGIAISACLNLLSIPNIVLEREDCCASLWKKRSYDRLKLHLAKQYCSLPNMPFPSHAPTFIPRTSFINYLDTYASNFRVNPLYNRSVESASHDGVTRKWRVVARNVVSGEVEVYIGGFLVVATGENSEGLVPNVKGLKGFKGKIMHSSEYENGERFKDKDVLVVGCGNSGMEIAHDLSNCGATTSISVRSPVHVLTKEMVQLGMFLLKYLSCTVVDKIVLLLGKVKFGNFARYGLQRPTKGPFYLKLTTGRSPVIDVGTMEDIKSGKIQVFPTIAKVQKDNVFFTNDNMRRFDAIIFATGYKSNVQKWLKDGKDLFNENGMPKRSPPGHWKGEHGLYAVGFARAGLAGIRRDAESVAKDIQMALLQQKF